MHIKMQNKHQSKKDFGYPDEKYAKGCGCNGYSRCYGVNKYGNQSKNRSRFELKSVAENNITKEMLDEFKRI